MSAPDAPLPELRRDYRAVLRRLAALDDAAAAQRAEAHDWYAARVAADAAAVRAAAAEVRAADGEVRAAERAVEEVDARAAGMWSEYVHRTGRAAERFGRTPPSAQVPRQRTEADPDDGGDPEECLREAESLIAFAPAPRPLGGLTTAAFAAFGAAGGAVGTAGRQLLRWAGRAAGGDWAAGLPVVALLVLLLGPVLAVLVAKRVADRRRVPLTAGAVVTVLVAGVLTAAVLGAVLESR